MSDYATMENEMNENEGKKEFNADFHLKRPTTPTVYLVRYIKQSNGKHCVDLSLKIMRMRSRWMWKMSSIWRSGVMCNCGKTESTELNDGVLLRREVSAMALMYPNHRSTRHEPVRQWHKAPIGEVFRSFFFSFHLNYLFASLLIHSSHSSPIYEIEMDKIYGCI